MKTIIRTSLPLLAAAWIALSSGCQSLPAVPEHSYYRLQASTAAPLPHPLVPDRLTVKTLRGDGLYGERPMIFADGEQRRLQQYHYHHWFYPPGQLVQEYLAQRLRLDRAAPTVEVGRATSDAGYALSGRIVHFEKVMEAGHASALAELELRLDKNGRVVWEGSYRASEAVTDAANGFVIAMEASLDKIYRQMEADLTRAALKD